MCLCIHQIKPCIDHLLGRWHYKHTVILVSRLCAWIVAGSAYREAAMTVFALCCMSNIHLGVLGNLADTVSAALSSPVATCFVWCITQLSDAWMSDAWITIHLSDGSSWRKRCIQIMRQRNCSGNLAGAVSAALSCHRPPCFALCRVHLSDRSSQRRRWYPR